MHDTKHIHLFNLSSRTWEQRETKGSESVEPRIVHSAVVYKDKMIVFGGRSLLNHGALDDVVVLDLRTWVWSCIGHSSSEPYGPGGRDYHSSHIFGDRMYVVMGSVDAGEVNPNHPPSVVWYLDLVTGDWVAVPPSPHAPTELLSGHAVAQEGEHIYTFGGMTRQADGVQHFYNDLYTFSLKTHEWKRITMASGSPLPPARYGAALGCLNGVVYLFGGDQPTKSLLFGDFWRVDTNGGEALPQWELMQLNAEDQPCEEAQPVVLRTHSWSNAERPSPRSGMAYTMVKGVLYVLGGEAMATALVPPTTTDFASLPLGLPSIATVADITHVGYDNTLFMYPLGLDSASSSLHDRSAQWLISSWANDVNWRPADVSENFDILSALSGFLPAPLDVLHDNHSALAVEDR